MVNKFTKYITALIGLAVVVLPSVAFAQTEGASAAAATLGIVFFFISMIFILAWFAFVAFIMVYWILMLIDCIKRDNWETDNDKTLWILVILLAGIIGAFIYRFVIVSKLGKAGKATEVHVIKKSKSAKK